MKRRIPAACLFPMHQLVAAPVPSFASGRNCLPLQWSYAALASRMRHWKSCRAVRRCESHSSRLTSRKDQAALRRRGPKSGTLLLLVISLNVRAIITASQHAPSAMEYIIAASTMTLMRRTVSTAVRFPPDVIPDLPASHSPSSLLSHSPHSSLTQVSKFAR